MRTDENLPGEAAGLLKSAGHDASSILEQGMRGEADPDVASVCRAEGRVLLALDLGFADIRTYPPAEYHGLVVLRPGRQDKGRVMETIARLLPMFATERLAGTLWIVGEERIRIRD